MKVLISWLNDLIDLGGRSAEDIAETLENLGHEVERMTPSGLPSTIVVSQVLEVKPHPNADRLRVAIVDTGKTSRTIVCGAPNLEAGQKVAVALPGTRLPNDLTIEQRSVRGIVSEGMICSPQELGLSEDHAGILVLEADRLIGESLSEGGADTVLELAVTANRGDVLSYVGVARELGAKWSTVYRLPSTELKLHESLQVDAQIENPVGCPLYTARLIKGIEQKNLPATIMERLKAVDHHLYHPVVDITNYVMEEFGVPLHAFDADKVSGPISVRPATSGETIELIDGKTYQLEAGMLVIADATGPIALAGIMGGVRTAISGETSRVILEAAFFDPSSIRRTRTKLGLATSASYRFERGTDPEAARQASDRAVALIVRYLGGQAGPRIEAGQLPHTPRVPFDPAAINDRLGTDVPASEQETILSKLGFEVEEGSVTVPAWRHDVTIIEDLAEEVARLHGYDTIPRTSLHTVELQSNPHDQRWLQIEAIKDQLVAAGWTESIGSTFLSEREREMLRIEPAELVKLANPVSEEAAYLRSTEYLSLLKVIAKNPIFPDLKIFELGTIWNPDERTVLTLAWTGRQPVSLPIVETSVGSSVAQELLNQLKIRRPVMLAELPVEELITKVKEPKPVFIPSMDVAFRPPSRFQSSLRDVAILVDKSVDPQAVADQIASIDSVVDIELFDQYSGGKFASSQQSLAFHLLIEHPEKNLMESDIQTVFDRIILLLKEQFNAAVR